MRWTFRSRRAPFQRTARTLGDKFLGKKTDVLLTKRVVDAATPGPARFDMWDSNLVGCGWRCLRRRRLLCGIALTGGDQRPGNSP